MKVLIVSDTHRMNTHFFEALEKESPVDLVVHAGDVEGSEYAISSACDCPVKMVMGNNDFFSDLPREEEFDLEGYHVLLVHGHYQYVSSSESRLRELAAEKNADIVIFGHTHYPFLDMEGSPILINPGSLTYPRQENHAPSYAVMEIHEDGDIMCELKYL